MSTARVRARGVFEPVRSPSSDVRFARDAWSAGNRPKTIGVSAANTSANVSVVPSIAMLPERGRLAVGDDTTHRTIATAPPTPTTHATIATRAFSINI
jgi:hypothetical protein